MTAEEKSEILAKISLLLDKAIDDPVPKNDTEPCEMLTIKECAQAVKGLSEHTIRKLVARGEIASIRTGEGNSGKILIPKASLIAFINEIWEK